MKSSRCLQVLTTFFIVASLLVSQLGTVAADAVSVETGYPTEGLEDLIWAAEYLGYENPGELQKAGVEVLRFLLVAIAQAMGAEGIVCLSHARWVRREGARKLHAYRGGVASSQPRSPAGARALQWHDEVPCARWRMRRLVHC